MVGAIKSRRSEGHNRQSFGHSGSGHSFKKRHSPEDDTSFSSASTPVNSPKSSMNASQASTPNNSMKNTRSVIVEALKGHKDRTDPKISPPDKTPLPAEAPSQGETASPIIVHRYGSSTISFDELEKEHQVLHRALAAERQAAQAAISTITRPPPSRAHPSSSCEIASSLPVSSGQSATTERVRSTTQ